MFTFLRRSAIYSGSAARFSTAAEKCRFGLILDADGVVTRGRELLPGSKEALQMLTDIDGKFKIPTVFLTNASNTMRAAKASRLSDIFGIHIKPSQVMMAHSPLRLFTELHEKPVLVSGQGPVREIAFSLGFRDVTTIKDLQTFLPQLDVVDSRRRRAEPFAPTDHGFKPIEAILMLGEPLNWESALQLIIDTLITNGFEDLKGASKNYPHIPIIVCNPDLFWLGERGLPMPRFGHGVFLETLEKIYQRMTNKELQFHAILGKPTEVTYMHASHCAQAQASQMGLPPVETVYAIGDNTETDIVGANLFECHLQTGENGRFDNLDLSRLNQSHFRKDKKANQLKHCVSVLAETGETAEVNMKNHMMHSMSGMLKRLSLSELESYKRPVYIQKDLKDAIKMVCKRENFHLL